MPRYTNQRKLSNLLIDRAALARLSIPFFIMIFTSVALVVTIRWKIIEAHKKIVLVGLENLTPMNTLLDLQRTVTVIGIVGLIFFALTCFALWVIYSHRIFGPMVPLRRHVQQLSAGDYASRIHLRGRDEFKPLADDLNALAEILESGSAGHSLSKHG